MADKAVTEAVLFDDCVVRPGTLVPLLDRLRAFAARYRPRLLRREQVRHLVTVLHGLHSDLPRKTVEPIAIEYGQLRRNEEARISPWRTFRLLPPRRPRPVPS